MSIISLSLTSVMCVHCLLFVYLFGIFTTREAACVILQGGPKNRTILIVYNSCM